MVATYDMANSVADWSPIDSTLLMNSKIAAYINLLIIYKLLLVIMSTLKFNYQLQYRRSFHRQNLS